MKKRILHFSPVKKEHQIVNLHLKSLEDLNISDIDITFAFFDDNVDHVSSILIENFIKKNNNSILFTNDDFLMDKNNKIQKERWTQDLYDRITLIKNYGISYFLNGNYDYLFLTDSDLILHPETLKTLLKQDKHFCAEIFWTKFKGSPAYSPNAWYSGNIGFSLENLLLFKNKGTYQVDFTGACTLLSRQILSDDVTFKKIPNVSYLGEDKHFCIRASVRNYEIYVNTEYPAFHLYEHNLLNEGMAFVESGYDLHYLDKWLDSQWENVISKWVRPKKKSITKKLILFLKSKINATRCKSRKI